MTFALLQQRLVSLIRDRVRSGEITESGLARLMGLSQPHIHNVLSGRRRLSPGAADDMLSQFRIDLLDLLQEEREERSMRRISLLREPIGPGAGAPAEGGLYVDVSFAAVSDLEDPVIARVGKDGELPGALRPGDWVLLDRGQRARRRVTSAICAVEIGRETVLRHVRRSGRDLAILPRDSLSMADRDILEVVKAKVVSFGRRLEQPEVE